MAMMCAAFASNASTANQTTALHNDKSTITSGIKDTVMTLSSLSTADKKDASCGVGTAVSTSAASSSSLSSFPLKLVHSMLNEIDQVGGLLLVPWGGRRGEQRASRSTMWKNLAVGGLAPILQPDQVQVLPAATKHVRISADTAQQAQGLLC
jgi:hypothetical protein